MGYETKLEMKDISIEFPGVKALSNVNFSTSSGRVHAIVGANGAGKSTLMKVLGGVETTWTGEILINGERVNIRNPQDAKALGIEIVYQEVDMALALNMSVAENILLSSTVAHSKGKPFMNWREVKRIARETLARMDLDIDINKRASEIPLAQRQMVLIARAIVEKCRILVLDEPTAPLSKKETDELFRIVRDLTSKQGIAVIFISHRLPELFEICQDITIMRDGRVVHVGKLEHLTMPQIVELLLGRKFDEKLPKSMVQIGGDVLRVEQLTAVDHAIHDVSFHVRKGEIVGIAGLVGAGKSELCKALFGDLRIATGKILLKGKEIRLKNSYRAVKYGFALVPEERRKEGILVQESVYWNLTAASLGKFCGKIPFIRKKEERIASRKAIADIGIKTPDENRLVGYLSGGNQQKVAIGKWLLADADVYIFDEPTKGIDVGAKSDVFELIGKLVENGKCVIYASCENAELLGITDRIYVMYDGSIVKELETAKTTENEILYYSIGGTEQ